MTNNEITIRERTFVCEILQAFIKKELTLRNGKTVKAATDSGINLSLTENLNWNLLERIAALNGLIAIFQDILGTSQIPEQKRDKWKRFSVQTLFDYTQAEKATVNLLKILEEESIPAIALRGMSLTQWVYSDPVLRPMCDVDLFVPSEARHDITSKLEKHGLVCVRTLRSQYIYDIDNTKFEIHWSFLTPRRYRKAANFDKWIDNRQSIKKSKGTIYCLSAENELLELVCHAFIHHELDTLLKLTDIALVANTDNLDWGYIGRWCENSSMSKLFAITFGLIDYLFNFNLLDNFPRKNVLPPKVEKYYEAYSAHFFQMDTKRYVFHRKQAMFFAAEKNALKFKQLLRFVSINQIKELMKAPNS